MTDQERKAMEMALEALENVYGKGKRCEAAITVLRQALAQPEEISDYHEGWEEGFKAGLVKAQPEQEPFEMEWPDYNESAMGCGLEDRNITDRYEAMQYGWDEAISRVSECLPDVLYTAPPSKPCGDTK